MTPVTLEQEHPSVSYATQQGCAVGMASSPLYIHTSKPPAAPLAATLSFRQPGHNNDHEDMTIMSTMVHLQRNGARAHVPPTLHPILTFFSTPPIPPAQPLPSSSRSAPPSEGSFMPHDAWKSRPSPAALYGQLEELFPDHDLDKPVIDTMQPDGRTPVTPSDGVVAKKSIRSVVSEHSSSLSAEGTPRTRAKRLWDSCGEEITPVESAGPPGSPQGVLDPKPIFKWIKGDLIGKGRHGRVYLALNATTGEMLAVKQFEVPKPASDQENRWWQQMMNWLKSDTLKDIDHPNVVQCLGFDQSADFLNLFLEYVPGSTIGRCLRKYGRFDRNIVRMFTSQIVEGLAHIHSRGVTHGNLKADSILLDPSGICKICDLGVPKHSEDTRFSTIQSSVFWMAPEVVRNDKQTYSPNVDIWGLGCLVLEMWSGERPWNPDDILTVVLKLGTSREGPPVPNDVQLDNFEDDFRQKCFTPNPDDRPTAAKLREHKFLELDPTWKFSGFG